ncbi:MAG: hypothetical protein KKA62_01830 [Nanoarchaeota archaeon]|nr:hypothetical protein [Nanoarchaeota archaeon]MBU1643821.1 hypothetical protein [Nanoarchaeota archaeon]MBU1976673.1 hypothetical protein [Nanoarchaeota archaeon]
MASIKEFRIFLETEAERNLFEILESAKLLQPHDLQALEDFKFSAIQKLNEIYFETTDFVAWFERQKEFLAMKRWGVVPFGRKVKEEVYLDLDHLDSLISNIKILAVRNDFIEPNKRNITKWIENIIHNLEQTDKQLIELEKMNQIRFKAEIKTRSNNLKQFLLKILLNIGKDFSQLKKTELSASIFMYIERLALLDQELERREGNEDLRRDILSEIKYWRDVKEEVYDLTVKSYLNFKKDLERVIERDKKMFALITAKAA